jgi:hypothetical protein
MGRFREAVSYSRQALSIVRDIGDRHGEGITLTKLGAALCAGGWQCYGHCRRSR